ncbi:MAG TPA: hypothetical protein VNL14_11200 [Candidatus Acidoferrales bacterium]|nr:hypothetical protein [Candidatus Acidoferrales bacterium]
MAKRSRLIVLGTMGRMPLAGVAWQCLHYLEGFRRLGFDVYYVEDTGQWSYDPRHNTLTADCAYAVNYLARVMEARGWGDRWAYRAARQGGRLYGLPERQFHRLFASAGALVNLTAATVLREEHRRVPVRVYLETDPVLPQVRVARGDADYIEMLAAHTHHFSFGENLGAPDCGVPVERFRYRPTRQPVVLEWWAGGAAPGGLVPPRDCFTTIANWRQTEKDLEWQGESYTWSKHYEFLKFVALPRKTPQPLELALALKSDRACAGQGWEGLSEDDAATLRLLAEHGWRTVSGMRLSKNLAPYRDYILSSRGEFTVAKDQNVRLRSGWFSDRSACYLAAGRPVVTQDTAFGKFLPTGEGLFAFNTMAEILTAFDTINSAYERHSRAARALAAEYFKAETVLARLAAEAGL